jgi:hypothetical protein
LSSHFHRQVLAMFIYVLDTLALVKTQFIFWNLFLNVYTLIASHSFYYYISLPHCVFFENKTKLCTPTFSIYGLKFSSFREGNERKNFLPLKYLTISFFVLILWFLRFFL